MEGDQEFRPVAEVHWEGDSREVLQGFPEQVRSNLGFALYEMQLGRRPTISARRMASVGEGVFELKVTKEPGIG